MKEVCLVGLAEPTRDLWRDLPEGIEIWSLNYAWDYGIPYDRLLDIHPIEWLRISENNPADVQGHEHWKRLTYGMGCPVYMLDAYPEIPGSVRLPVEDILKRCGRFFFTSGGAWLAGLAIIEGYERIYAYGWDMRSDSEYGYQRESMSWLIGFCDGAGIDLVLPNISTLCNSKLYGYEAQAMISRQTLEGHLLSYKSQREEMIGRVNVQEGKRLERVRLMDESSGDEREKWLKLVQEAETEKKRCLRVVMGIEGAIQAVQHLIDNCDLAEVDTTIADKLRTIQL